MKNHAFTLVELIVAVVIIVIIATITFISMGTYTATTRDAKRYSDITELYKKIDIEQDVGIEDLVNVTST
jgi:prepilin-type N-terminal cleavage/methylation domain-containing protein